MTYVEDYGAAPEKRGMSTGTVVLLTVGGGCGVLALLCCGGFLFFGYLVGERAKEFAENAVSDDPAVIRAATDEIVDIRVPVEVEPAFSMVFKVPFVDQLVIAMVGYRGTEDDSFLLLGEFGREFAGGKNADQLYDEIEKSLRQQGEQHEQINIDDSEEFTLEIGGEEATFVLSHGKGAESGIEYYQVIGKFPAKNGPGMLVYYIPADDRDKDDVRQAVRDMIESIDTPGAAT